MTLAFLQIYEIECVAMILEKKDDSQMRALGAGASEIPSGYRHNLGLWLISFSAVSAVSGWTENA